MKGRVKEILKKQIDRFYSFLLINLYLHITFKKSIGIFVGVHRKGFNSTLTIESTLFSYKTLKEKKKNSCWNVLF